MPVPFFCRVPAPPLPMEFASVMLCPFVWSWVVPVIVIVRDEISSVLPVAQKSWPPPKVMPPVPRLFSAEKVSVLELIVVPPE